MLIVIVVMTALAMLIVLVVMMTTLAMLIVLVMMVSTLAMLIVLVMMMAALAMLIVLVVMMTALAMLIVLVVMMTASTMLVMLVVMLMLVLKMLHILCESILLFHRAKYRLSIEAIPRSSNDNGILIVFSYDVECLLELMLFSCLCMRENDAGCVLDLIAKELTKVLHIHLALVSINNSGKGVKLRLLAANCRSRLDNVGELSNS